MKNLLIILAIVLVIYLLMTAWPKNTATVPKPITEPQNKTNITTSPLPPIVNSVISAADKANINPAVLLGIISTEQGTTDPTKWNLSAQNLSDPNGGSYGLAQIELGTANLFGVNSAQNLLDPQTNLNVMTQFLNQFSPNPNNIIDSASVWNNGQNAPIQLTPYVHQAINNENYWNNYIAGVVG